MILVIGATGMVGGEICRQLASDGFPVRAMIRNSSDPAKVHELSDMGIELIRGDLRDTSTFTPALKSVSEVILTASSMPFSYVANINDIDSVDKRGVMDLIDRVKKTDVQKFIYLSFSGHLDEECPLQKAKRAVEKHLKNSGIPYTILRPSFFMEVWLTSAVGFDTEHHHAQLWGDGTKPISYISYKDVARFAIESLTNPAARNAVLEIGGPNQLSQWDAVRIFEEVSGAHFDVERVPIDVLEKQRKDALDPMQQSFPTLMLDAAKGDPIEMNEMIKKFPVALTSVRQYAQSVMARRH